MADLFPAQVDNANGEFTLFPVQQPPVNRQSEVQQIRTALLASVAMTDVAGESVLALQTQMLERAETNHQLIQSGNEKLIRDNISSTVDARNYSSIERELFNPTEGSDTAQVIQDLVNFNISQERRNREYDLEVLAAEGLQDMASFDPTQRDIEIAPMSQRVADITARYEALNKLADELELEFQDQGIKGVTKDIIDFTLAAFAPGNETTAMLGLVPLTDKQRKDTSAINFGTKQYLEGMQLMFGMSQEEFFNFLPTLKENIKENATDLSVNKFLIREQIDSLMGLAEQDVSYRNTIAAIDGFDIGLTGLALAGSLLKGSRSASPTTLLARTGNRQEAASMALGSIELPEAPTGVARAETSTDNLISKVAGTPAALREALPESMTPFRELSVGLGGDSVELLEAQAATVDKVLQGIIPVSVSSGDEFAAAISRTLEQQKPLTGETVHDVRVVRSEGLLKTPSLEIILKSKTGLGGYVSEASAKRAATRRGIKDSYIVQDDSGQHFIAFRARLNERDFITPTPLTELPDVSSIGRILKNPLNILGTNDRQNILTSEFAATRLHEEVVKPIAERVQGLPSKSYKALDKIMTRGVVDKKEYTPAELDDMFDIQLGRNATDKEKEAYYSVLQLNRLSWAMDNEKRYNELVDQGVQAVGANYATGIEGIDKGLNGIEVKSLDEVAGNFVYHLGERDLIKGSDVPEGQRVVKLLTPVITDEGDVITHLAGADADLHIGALDTVQVGYTPGGHLLYKGKNFVKQARTITNNVRGESVDYILEPRTYIASETVGGARKWADDMNLLRDVYNRFTNGEATIDEVTDVLSPSGYRTVDELANGIDNGEISLTHPFEAVADGEYPSEFFRLIDKSGMINTAADPAKNITGTQVLGSRGLTTNRQRSDTILKSPINDIAMLVSPLDTLSKLMSRSIRTNAWHTYKTDSVERWLATAKDFIVTPNENVPDFFAFQNVQYEKGTPETIIKRLESQRQALLTVLRTKTDTMHQFDKWYGRMIDNIRDEGIVEDGLTVASKRTKVADFFGEDPITALRGAAFQLKLGLFDVGQVFLQIQASAAAASIDPIAGAKAIGDTTALRMALMKGAPDGGNLSQFKLIEKLSSRTPEEFAELYEAVQRTGFHHVSGEHAFLDNYSLGGGIVRKHGSFFFVETERMNRLYAFSMAAERYRRANRGASILTDEALKAIKDDAAMLTQDMVAASKRNYQKGVLSLPTQFLSYMTNMTENVLPQALGGSNRLTSAEKARLGAGQLVLYGAAGLPFGHELMDYIASKYEEATGEPMSEEVEDGFRFGIEDFMLSKVTGMDTAIAERASIGGGISQNIRKIIGADAGHSSFADVMGGPAVSTAVSIGGTVADMAKLLMYPKLTPETFAELGADVTNELLKEASSFKRGHQAYMAAVYKRLETGSGITVGMTDKPLSAALMALAGVPLKQQFDFYQAAAIGAADKDFVNSVTKRITTRLKLAVDNPDQEELQWRTIGVLLEAIPEGDRAKVIDDAWHRVDPSSLDKYIRTRRDRHKELQRR